MNQLDGILEFQSIFALFLLSFSNPTKQQHVWEGYGGSPSTVIHLIPGGKGFVPPFSDPFRPGHWQVMVWVERIPYILRPK